MQQIERTANNTPVTLSPEFQDWLNKEKMTARHHRSKVVKTAAFFVVALLILLFSNQGPIQGLVDQVLLIAQP